MSKRLPNCSPCAPDDWGNCCVQGRKRDPATNTTVTAVGNYGAVRGWLDSGPGAAAAPLDGHNWCYNSTDAEQGAGFHELAAHLAADGGAHPAGVADGLLRFEFVEAFINGTTGLHGAAPPPVEDFAEHFHALGAESGAPTLTDPQIRSQRLL